MQENRDRENHRSMYLKTLAFKPSKFAYSKVFKCFLKTSMSVILFSSFGISFHNLGPMYEKDLRPYLEANCCWLKISIDHYFLS